MKKYKGLWQVWYCIERNELTLWARVYRPTKYFKAEHIKTKKEVTMFFVGDL